MPLRIEAGSSGPEIVKSKMVPHGCKLCRPMVRPVGTFVARADENLSFNLINIVYICTELVDIALLLRSVSLSMLHFYLFLLLDSHLGCSGIGI